MNKNNLGNLEINSGDILTVNKQLELPNEINSTDIIGNIRQNITLNKIQYFDGTTWQTFDTSLGTNLWELSSGTYIKPVASITNGIKINNISPISGTNVYVDSDFVCQGIQSEGPFGASSWLTGSFGTNGGKKVVIGTDPNDFPLIGGHLSDLSNWSPLNIQRFGAFGTGDLNMGGSGSKVNCYSIFYTDTITGLTTPTSGTLFGISIASSSISADNIVFSPTTLRQYVNNSGSVGLLAFPVITDNGDGSISVASVNCQIRGTNSSTDKIEFLTVSATISPLVIPSNTTRYLIVSYNTGIPIYSLSTSVNTDLQTQILCAIIYRVPLAESNELYINKNIATIVNDTCKNFMITTGQRTNIIKWQSGASLGFSSLQFNASLGKFNEGVNNFETVAKLNGDSFKYLYHNAGVFVESTTQTNINITQYDNGTNLATITPTSSWGVQFVYATTDLITRYYVIYGTSIASSLSNALAIPLPSSIPSRLQSCGILLGKIIFQRSANIINSVISSFNSSVSYQGITNHADLAGLSVDDHSQYALINALPRSETDYLSVNKIQSGGTTTNLDLELAGKNAGVVKTTSALYANLGLRVNSTIGNSTFIYSSSGPLIGTTGDKNNVVMGNDGINAYLGATTADLANFRTLAINNYSNSSNGGDVIISAPGKKMYCTASIILPNYNNKSTDVEGQLEFDYTAHNIKFYNGTAWHVITSVPAIEIQKINNDHGVDPNTYTYLQKKFIEIPQYVNKKFNVVNDENKKLRSELEKIKNELLEIKKKVHVSYIDEQKIEEKLKNLSESELGNSINFVGS